jgi:hypothetical protein
MITSYQLKKKKVGEGRESEFDHSSIIHQLQSFSIFFPYLK